MLIDEVSLLNCEINAEIDAALRFAKEKPDEWHGGIIVIFAGDLYQYPPVCGTPLYNSIAVYSNQTNDEITKRLGQLAWKTINSVITFIEQERMKGDHEYAEAVARFERGIVH